MKAQNYRIFPLSTGALTIELGTEISHELNDRTIEIAEYFEANPFPGLREIVPAYASVTIFFECLTVRKHFGEFETAFDAVKFLAENACRQKSIKKKRPAPRILKIPVDFSVDHAPDLSFVADYHHLSPERVVEIFTAATYRVYMLGFMPAFAYMGEVPERIAAPRKTAPRVLVPQGSVGIAGRQTGIYPFDSPGGWQIIGKTDFPLFTPQAEVPCALRSGDRVKFYAVQK